jgi:hypothetical protein
MSLKPSNQQEQADEDARGGEGQIPCEYLPDNPQVARAESAASHELMVTRAGLSPKCHRPSETAVTTPVRM